MTATAERTNQATGKLNGSLASAIAALTASCRIVGVVMGKEDKVARKTGEVYATELSVTTAQGRFPIRVEHGRSHSVDVGAVYEFSIPLDKLETFNDSIVYRCDDWKKV